MRPLYALTNEWLAIAELIASSDEVPVDLELRMAAIEQEMPNKVNALCALRQQYKHEAEAAKLEAERLRALSKVRENAADRLGKYLKEEMERMGLRAYETSIFKTWIQNNPPSARCEMDVDPQQLPAPFLKVKIEYSLDSKAAIEAWKAKQPLPRGVVVEQGNHLRVK